MKTHLYQPWSLTLYNYQDACVNPREVSYNYLNALPAKGKRRDYSIDPAEDVAVPYQDAYLGVRNGVERLAYYGAGGQPPRNQSYYRGIDADTNYAVPTILVVE